MRTPEENVKHMHDMGYTNIKPSMFYNSAMAACQYVKKIMKAIVHIILVNKE